MHFRPHIGVDAINVREDVAVQDLHAAGRIRLLRGGKKFLEIADDVDFDEALP